MGTKRVILAKQINGDVEYLYPKTVADMILYSDDETTTVKGKIDSINEDINVLYNEKLNKVLDENGNITNGTSGQVLQTNGDGTTNWVDNVSVNHSYVTVYADKWIETPLEGITETLVYGQEVNVNNAVVTQKSKVDMQLDSAQVAIFREKDLSFVPENDSGVVTVYSIGEGVPRNNYDIQVTVTEIDTDKSKIIGNHVGVPNPKINVDQIIKDNTTYNNTEPLVNDIGGILAEQHTDGFNNVPITDLITELLYPYTEPIVESFTLNPGAGVKEKNVSITLESASVKVTKKSKNISKVSLYRGSTLLKEYTGEVSLSGTTVNFSDVNDALDGKTNTTYTVKVSEENGTKNVVSTSATYTFVDPYYYGVINKNETIGSDVITKLTKSVSSKGTKNYPYTTTKDQCSVIAYPSSYGKISSIKDPNGFTQTWSLYTISINNTSYYVYVSGAAAATNFRYTFTY